MTSPTARLTPSPGDATTSPHHTGRQRRYDAASPTWTTRRTRSAAKVIGALALVASALYFLTDVIEVVQGGFSAGQLWLTLVAEAAIPVFVVGIAALFWSRLGLLGRLSALAYAYSYVVFTGTVVYALVNHTKDYRTLNGHLGVLMFAHGAIMVFAGLGLGYAMLGPRLLPASSCVCLMAGVVLVAAAQGLPDGAQLVAAGARDLGFAGMGAALIGGARPATAASPDDAAIEDAAAEQVASHVQG
jgi:hypothetical protein